MSGAPLRIALLGLAASVAACSSTSAHGGSEARATATVAGQVPQNGPLDACTLISWDEVTATVGRKDLARGKSKDEGTLCYYSSSRGSVSVWVIAARPRKDFDDFRQLLVDQGKQVEDVAGVGDAAYFWDDRLYVQVGTRGITVQVNPNELAPSAPGALRPVVIALARLGAGRLR